MSAILLKAINHVKKVVCHARSITKEAELAYPLNPNLPPIPPPVTYDGPADTWST